MIFGAQCIPKPLEIRDHCVEIYMDPKGSDQDVNDIIAAVREVDMVVMNS